MEMIVVMNINVLMQAALVHVPYLVHYTYKIIC